MQKPTRGSYWHWDVNVYKVLKLFDCFWLAETIPNTLVLMVEVVWLHFKNNDVSWEGESAFSEHSGLVSPVWQLHDVNIWCNLISQTRLITKMIELLYVPNPTATSALPLNGEFERADDPWMSNQDMNEFFGCNDFCWMHFSTIQLDAMSLRVGKLHIFANSWFYDGALWTLGENLLCCLYNLNWAVQARGVEKSSILRFHPYFLFICKWHKPSISHLVGKIILSYNPKVGMIFVPISLLAGGCKQIVYL